MPPEPRSTLTSNLMAFLQQDALHLSDLFRSSAQQWA